MNRYLLCISFICVLLNAGCSVVVGNIKPVDEKSKNYKVMDLNREEWKKLPPAEVAHDSVSANSEIKNSEPDTSETTDLAFQSQLTSSIISMNSACRPSVRERELGGFTQQLLLGISDVSERSEIHLKIADQDALQTTVNGKMNRTFVKIRTIVLKKDNCAYDLMYISKPADFEKQEDTFLKFAQSLVIK